MTSVSPSTASLPVQRAVYLAVLVAALGYFVDVFDMWLFANYRVQSLRDLGLSPEAILTEGATLLNMQLAGLVLGGFIWGVLADKRGRTSVMFGSIFLYSTATFLNAFVETVEQYKILRFISGIGLAGEIGAGITLVVELLPDHKRGWGTTFVTALGVAGALGAAAVAKILDWKSAYILGGVMGFALLVLRFMVHESGVFHRLKEKSAVVRGSLRMVFGSPSRLGRMLLCVLCGAPLFVVFAVVATFSPEIAASIGIPQKITVPDVMIWASVGMTIGDVLAGSSAQWFRSRKKPLYAFMITGLVLFIAMLQLPLRSDLDFKVMMGLLAASCGYWACLITMVAEQFGTNIRATVTTAAPNLIRGTGILSTSSFVYCKGLGMAAHQAALVTGCVVFSLALVSLLLLRETYGAPLEFEES